MDAQLKVSRAITKLVVGHPFFGSMALSVRVERDDEQPTMCTDGRFIKWNAAFVDEMSEPETLGVIAHEVMHIVLKHMLRLDGRDQHKWNVACDYAINAILLDSGFTLPTPRLHDEKYKNLTAEAIYDRLPDSEAQSQDAGFGVVVPAKGEDDRQLSDAEAKQLEADIDGRVMVAAEAAKTVGKLPHAIEQIIKRMKRAQVDYRDKMRRMIGGDQPDDYSFRRPQRRMYHMTGIVAPSIEKIGAGDEIVYIDTSGSVSNVELQHFLGELNAIVEDMAPRSITVITADTQVRTVRRYEQGEHIDKIEVGGRGGTAVAPVFEYIREHNLPVDNMICLTDLEIWDFPEAPHFPVLWVSSYQDAKPAPFGETVYIQT